jgi:hypothetical protein
MSGFLSISLMGERQPPIADFIGFLSPGIVFGTAIYLFGKYSSSPRIDKRNWIASYTVITVASTLGWYLANRTGAAHDSGYPLYLRFLVAGLIGGIFIVFAELLCWRFKFHRFAYAAGIVIVAGLASFIDGYFLFPNNRPFIESDLLLLFVSWQFLVLISHAIAFAKTRKT